MCQSRDGVHSLPRSVWIVATGSRGDIQPYVAVGAAMVKRGYNVTFLTYDSYAAFAETLGMKGVSLGQDYETSITTNDKVHKGMKQGDVLVVLSGMAHVNRKNAPVFCESFLAELNESGPPDLCIATPMNQYLAWYLYLQYHVPFQIVNTFAFAYNPDRIVGGLPKSPSGVTSYILHHALINGSYDGFSAYDEYLNVNILDTFTKAKHMEFYKNPTLPMVTLSSPEFASILYSKGICENWKFVGSAVISSQEQVKKLEYFGGKAAFKELKDFLNSGSKPVYLGWANMVSKSPEEMAELCCRAVAHSGQRAIVKGGAAGLSLDVLMNVKDIDPKVVEYAKEKILFVEYAPHEWLFSQISATVHHGGQATTTAALRGGAPTVVTPVFGNHFDASRLVSLLNVGFGFSKQLQAIEWKELGNAIRTAATDSDMARRAAALGTRLQQEDGANEAVDEIEQYWNEYCITGKLYKTFPRPNEAKVAPPEESDAEGENDSTVTNETSSETDSDEGDGHAFNDHPYQAEESKVVAEEDKTEIATVYDETELDASLYSMAGPSEATENLEGDKNSCLVVPDLMRNETGETFDETKSFGESIRTESVISLDEYGIMNESKENPPVNEFETEECPDSRLIATEQHQTEESYTDDLESKVDGYLSTTEPREEGSDLVLEYKEQSVDEYQSKCNLNASTTPFNANDEITVPRGVPIQPMDEKIEEGGEEPSTYHDIESAVHTVLLKAEEAVQVIKAQAGEKILLLQTQTDDKFQVFKEQADVTLYALRTQLKANLLSIRTQTEEMLQVIQEQTREKLQVISAHAEERSQVIRAQAQEKLQVIHTQADAMLQRITIQATELLNESRRKLMDEHSMRAMAMARPLSRNTKVASAIACASVALIVSSRRR